MEPSTDLLIYKVEVTTDNACHGGTLDADYNATAVKKATKLIKDKNLKIYFEARCKKIFQANNIDYWYIEQLEILFE